MFFDISNLECLKKHRKENQKNAHYSFAKILI